MKTIAAVRVLRSYERRFFSALALVAFQKMHACRPDCSPVPNSPAPLPPYGVSVRAALASKELIASLKKLLADALNKNTIEAARVKAVAQARKTAERSQALALSESKNSVKAIGDDKKPIEI